ncbi:class II fumarate hydratase [Candidatus Acetothermia bacterium]|nr:class II fumarate hydratase [Candidatus Acetothermia bacterium]
MSDEFRVEKDTLGDVKIPQSAYWGPQTQRAVENFPISGLRLQPAFIRAQALIKKAAALANADLGDLDRKVASVIAQAADEILSGKHLEHFVVDVYQAGAGTSQNMNANEVIANRAIEILGGRRGDHKLVHPNDHVNRGQSTNDTIPTAIHISALEEITHKLVPALEMLHKALAKKTKEFDPIVKSGRTHLQDAVPMRLGQEFGAYGRMIELGIERLKVASEGLKELALGGNAVGTGINTPKGYSEKAVGYIAQMAKLPFVPAKDKFEQIQNRDAVVFVSGALRTVTTSLIKIADDFRLLSSGPKTGFNELLLPALQPGSSIMPGKINPVMPEMLNMVCFQILGHLESVERGAQAGQLELNVMMPMIAYNLLQAITLMANASKVFTARCVEGLQVNEEQCRKYAESTPQAATALNPVIGYEKAAMVVKESLASGKSIREIVLEKKLLPPEELDKALDLKKLT